MFQCLTPMHGGTVTFEVNQKGKIAGVGKISIDPYPHIDNVLFVKGLKQNLISISQLCDSGLDVSIVSKVLGKEVMLSMDTIAQVTGCIKEGSTYQEDLEKTYESHVPKALYGKNLKKADGKRRFNTTFFVIWPRSSPTSLRRASSTK